MAVEAAVRETRKRGERGTVRGRVTLRDIALLAHIARHRLLTTKQLAMLDGGSAQNVSRCMRFLFDHGYVEWLRPKLAWMPATFGLTRKGAQLVRDHGHRIDADIDWGEKNRRVGDVFIDHTIDMAEFNIRMELACAARGDVVLLDKHDVVSNSPEATQRDREPLRLRALIQNGNTRVPSSVIMDGLCGLVYPDDHGDFFFVEIDRGTVTIAARGFDPRYARDVDDKTFAKKLVTYYEAWRQSVHVQQYGIAGFRVLTVTTSADRINTMLNTVSKITGGGGSNLFLFGERDSLLASNPLNMTWVTGKGEVVQLAQAKKGRPFYA